MRSMIVGGVVILTSALVPMTTTAATYDVDASHSQVMFKVRHLGISKVSGTFDDFAGSFTFDADEPGSASAELTIQATSVNTRNDDRDEHLRSPEFLNIAEFPEIVFASTKISDVKDGTMKIHGDMTLHGVTKSVVFDAEMTGAVTDPWGNNRIAFEATTTIDRRDFGLTWSKALETGGLVVGHDVSITIEVEGVERKSEEQS